MNKAALRFVLPIVLVASVAFPQTPIQLSIVQPENGAVVPRRQCVGGRDVDSCVGTPFNVTGTSARLGSNTIVLFVYSPPAGRWFFQGEANVEADGSWEITDVVVSSGVRVQAGESPYQFVALAMSELPPGLSDVPEGQFPPPGTLAQSPVVLVQRGD